MSLETSIDALCHEFEIEDVREKDPVQEIVEQPITEAVQEANPMSFLDDDAQVMGIPEPTQTEVEDELPGPSVADLKKKANEDHKAIVDLEKEVKAATATQRYDLEDKAYMKAQLKALITDNRAVLDCIETQLKIGTNPHLFEVYAALSKTVSDNVMRLAKIDQMVTNYKIIEDKGTGNIKHDVAKEQAAANGQGGSYTQINNYNFASDEILKLVKKLTPPKEKVKLEDLPKFDLS